MAGYAISGVFDLAPDGEAARTVEQRPRVRAHHEQRQQVFEHRRAPGEEHGLSVHAVANPHTIDGLVAAVERVLAPR